MSPHTRPERIANERNTLAEVAKALAAHVELDELLEAMMDRIVNVLAPVEFGFLFLWEAEQGLFLPQVAVGPNLPNSEALYELALRADESVTGKVFNEAEAQLFETPEKINALMGNLRPENRAALQKATGTKAFPTSIIAAPVCAGENRYGVLILDSMSDTEDFSEHDLPFVRSLADLIALAIDRARLEKEARAIRQVQRSDKLRAETLATLSHELRTPLAAIKGYSTALMLEEVAWSPEKQAEFLRLIEEEADTLQGMITEILDSSIMDVGQFQLEYEPVRLERLAGEVAEEMQRRTEVHQMVLDFPADFPIIDADPQRVKQVIRNIVDNAIKYSPEGGLVVIKGSVRPKDVVVSVSDEGVGIAPEDLIPLFEKYFRVKSPTGHHVSGTGLGLPVARTVVEEHGGRIWAESEVGGGTTLYFSLPRQGPSDELEDERQAEGSHE